MEGQEIKTPKMTDTICTILPLEYEFVNKHGYVSTSHAEYCVDDILERGISKIQSYTEEMDDKT